MPPNSSFFLKALESPICISEVFASISWTNYLKSDHSFNLTHVISSTFKQGHKRVREDWDKSTWEQMSILMEIEIMTDGPAALPDEETGSSQCQNNSVCKKNYRAFKWNIAKIFHITWINSTILSPPLVWPNLRIKIISWTTLSLPLPGSDPLTPKFLNICPT